MLTCLEPAVKFMLISPVKELRNCDVYKKSLCYIEIAEAF